MRTPFRLLICKEKERRVNFMRTRDEVSGDEDDTCEEEDVPVKQEPRPQM